ncbi:Uma2 family endonuclease [Hymenobacter sp. ASUV-10]|uniref:Uma2 family endonuclease n=1 Tax=Hymenobacter aranciens TaxID=3063996 RepID=A0ABT9BFI2_9BACT|nr:Uma2 family endonuclease [Hymenobacter sp. ASUV-10]MDO7877034.1 Uma2 family endonuclease [Hymenobacter sp. ASUV-10]
MEQLGAQSRHYTVEEYFALEAQSEDKHEFFNGEVFAMAGASIPHNALAGNCFAAFKLALRGRPCKVVIEAVQLAVQEGRHYTYPDVMVSCDPADRQADLTMRAPVLLVEVLSPSTAEYDRGKKFNQYKQLPSLQHYLLVSQTSWLVEWYRREVGDIWSFTPLVEAEDTLLIPDLNINLTVAEIYEDTNIAPLRIISHEPMIPYGSSLI